MGGEGDQISKMFSQLTSNISGGISGLFSKLNESGMAEEVKSWVGKGENKPVTGEQVSQALGNEHLAKIAEQAGVTPEEAAHSVAQALPTMVDKLTPDGQMPDPQMLKANLASMMGKNTPMGKPAPPS